MNRIGVCYSTCFSVVVRIKKKRKEQKAEGAEKKEQKPHQKMKIKEEEKKLSACILWVPSKVVSIAYLN